MANNNGQIAEWQAQDAIDRGQASEQAVRMQTAAVKSSQRVAIAANGVALDEGSAVDVQTSTDYMGEMDALTVHDNALRSAWGYRVQASNYRDSARNARAGASGISSTGAALTSMLTNGGSVASMWYPKDEAPYNYANDESGGRFSATGANGPRAKVSKRTWDCAAMAACSVRQKETGRHQHDDRHCQCKGRR